MRNLPFFILVFTLFTNLKANPTDSTKTLKDYEFQAENELNQHQRLDLILKSNLPDREKLSLLDSTLFTLNLIPQKVKLEYLKKGLNLAKKKDEKFWIAHNQYEIGRFYIYDSVLLDSSKFYSEEALKNFRKIDSASNIAHTHRLLRYVNIAFADYEKALRHCYDAMKIFEQKNDKPGIGGVYKDIAIVMILTQNYDDALIAISKGIEILKTVEPGPKLKKQHTVDLGTLYKHQATCYLKKGDSLNTFQAMDKAIDVALKTDPVYDRLLINFLVRKGDLSLEFENYKEAKKEYLAVIEILDERNAPQLQYGLAYRGLAHIFKKEKQYQNAVDYFKKFEKVYSNQNRDFTKDIAECFFLMGQSDSAYFYQKEFQIYLDSLKNEEARVAMEELKTEYETEKKEQQIILLSQKEKTARNRNFLLLGLLGMLLLGGGVFYYRRQLNEQLRLQSMRTQISSDLHDEVGSSLAQLSMIMGSVEGTDPAFAKSYLQKGNEILSSSISKIRDVVWAIDAKNDGTGALLDRMEDFAYDMLSAKSIKYKINNSGFDRNTNLPPLIRQNFYLFYKEAITNIYKHSDATDVKIDFYRKDNNIYLKVADNGRDLNDKKVSGSGIENMKLRAKKIGGSFDFMKNENGFVVSLDAPTS